MHTEANTTVERGLTKADLGGLGIFVSTAPSDGALSAFVAGFKQMGGTT